MTDVIRETAQKVIRQEFKELQKPSDACQHVSPEGNPHILKGAVSYYCVIYDNM